MMIGNNTLQFNEATMMQAVQEYLDNRFIDSGKVIVKSVKKASLDNIFEIGVSSEGVAIGERVTASEIVG